MIDLLLQQISSQSMSMFFRLHQWSLWFGCIRNFHFLVIENAWEIRILPGIFSFFLTCCLKPLMQKEVNKELSAKGDVIQALSRKNNVVRLSPYLCIITTYKCLLKKNAFWREKWLDFECCENYISLWNRCTRFQKQNSPMCQVYFWTLRLEIQCEDAFKKKFLFWKNIF